LCDPVYGRGASRLGSVRDADLLEFLKTHDGQMLHAEVLEFTHPTTGEQMRFKTRLPADMMELKYILESI
jgi:23S rRNA pseudouridine1911/1915/1917 synthase